MAYGQNFILTNEGKLNLLMAHQLDAAGIDVRKVGSPTYLSLEDYIDTAGDSGLLSGGEISDDADGTITIAPMTGLIYTTASPTGTLAFFDLAQDTTVGLTDNALNYIYAQYNSGTPRYQATVNESDISGTDEFVVGIVWREGTDLHIANVGKHIERFNQQVYRHSFYLDGLQRMWGLVTTENGTRQLDVAVGALSWALHEIGVAAKTAGSFKLWYNDGAWQEGSAITTIPNTQYNDYGTGLATLTANRYGTYWIYLVTDGDMYGVYGVGNNTLAQAQAEGAPGNLPPELANIGVLIAKIIVQKSAANFYSITLPWIGNVASSSATDHGGLAGLSDIADHLYALLIDGTRPLTGDWDAGAFTIKCDTLQATDGNGLRLSDDSDTLGVFVEDGGLVTQPNQSAFSVYPSAVQANLVRDGWRTIEFDTEVFDVNSDFNTGTYTFTAPVTGKYVFTTKVRFENVPTSPTAFYLRITTSNRDYIWTSSGTAYASSMGQLTLNVDCVADMDANDTVLVQYYQAGGSSSVDTSNSPAYSNFQGYLLG